MTDRELVLAKYPGSYCKRKGQKFIIAYDRPDKVPIYLSNACQTEDSAWSSARRRFHHRYVEPKSYIRPKP